MLTCLSVVREVNTGYLIYENLFLAVLRLHAHVFESLDTILIACVQSIYSCLFTYCVYKKTAAHVYVLKCRRLCVNARVPTWLVRKGDMMLSKKQKNSISPPIWPTPPRKLRRNVENTACVFVQILTDLLCWSAGAAFSLQWITVNAIVLRAIESSKALLIF